MFKELMHAMIGNSAQQGAVSSALNMAQMNSLAGASLLATPARRMAPTTKKLFDGRIEVQQVANGFVVNIGTKEGYEYTTHIAQSITEVNEIIAAQIVAFRLEDNT